MKSLQLMLLFIIILEFIRQLPVIHFMCSSSKLYHAPWSSLINCEVQHCDCKHDAPRSTACMCWGEHWNYSVCCEQCRNTTLRGMSEGKKFGKDILMSLPSQIRSSLCLFTLCLSVRDMASNTRRERTARIGTAPLLLSRRYWQCSDS